ncbi:MAG: wax ester/triacylglycerol synthase domain-containing protein [Acidimicrobiales bacterium]
MARKEREFEASDRMSEHEALMWNVEKDPWLNASGASLTLLDKPADFEYLRRALRAAIVQMPRLCERVVPGFARLSTPAWAPDAEFDLSYHLQEIELPADGSQRTLFDLASRLYNEPLDRTRPLWRFVSIKGLDGGGGAIYSMMHHVIADGIGQMRMAEMYQQLTRDTQPPAEVDLEAFLAARIEMSDVKESGGDSDASLANAVRNSVAHVARRQLGIARRLAGEVVLWPADPGRMNDKLSTLGETASAALNQLTPSPDDEAHGSPLWTNRSRHRHLEHVSLNVDDLKAAGHAVGGSLNDAFMAGLAEGAHRYHAEREAPAQTFNSSFVLSTRTDSKAGGNSFTPVPVRLPGGPISITERLRGVHDAAQSAREQAQRTGGVGGLSGIANKLPTSVVTKAARAQGARIDFATSNLRGTPVELFCAGARVERIIAMGPVAGTGANITAMSYDGGFEIGMFIDPEAITDPDAFRDHVEAAFADMFAELVPKKPTAKKAVAKKPAPKKPTAKKAVANKPAPKKPTAKKAVANKTAAKPTS